MYEPFLFLFPSLYLYNSPIIFYSFDINFLFILYISVLINAMLIYLFVKNINNLVYLYFESLYTLLIQKSRALGYISH